MTAVNNGHDPHIAAGAKRQDGGDHGEQADPGPDRRARLDRFSANAADNVSASTIQSATLRKRIAWSSSIMDWNTPRVTPVLDRLLPAARP